MKFIHAADLHLDSPLRGLALYDSAPVEEIRAASRRALKKLVQLSIDERVRFVIFSGDVFDGDWKDYNTGLFFASQMSRLKQEGVRVFIAAGNHDAVSPISRSLKMPDNVHTFSSRAFESVVLDDIGVVIHGRSFPGREVKEDWVPSFPKPVKGAFNIGVLHTSVGGYTEHLTYAPCSLGSLINKGYDYWALGHVHASEILNRSPWVVFPGNIQGRHVRETGAKGCMLVSVTDNEVMDAVLCELDVLRWYNLVISARREDDVDALIGIFKDRLNEIINGAGGRIVAVRVTITGPCVAHEAFMKDPEKWRNELRAVSIDEGRGEVWLEKIRFTTDSTIPKASSGLIEELMGHMRKLSEDDDALLNSNKEALKKLQEKLPSEITTGEEALLLDNPAWLRKTLLEGMAQLNVRMTGSGGEI